MRKPRRKIPLREELERVYIVEKRSLREAAMHFSVSVRTLRRWFKRYGIQARSRSEALKEYLKQHPEAHQRTAIHVRGKKLSEEARAKIAASKKGKTWEEIYGVEKAVELRKKMSVRLKGEGNPNYGKKRPGYVREALSRRHKGVPLAKEHKEKIMRNSLAAVAKKPNKLETRVMRIIEQSKLPVCYTGNGKLIIGGLCPDFAAIKTKKLIEIFGDYWHSDKITKNRWKSTEFGKKAVYAQLGFDVLILWESEIKEMSDEDLKRCIEDFLG